MATTDAEKGVARRSSSVAEKGVAFRASHARDNNGLVSSKDTYLVDLGLGDSLDDRKPRTMNDKAPLICKTDPLARGFFEGILRPCVAEFVGVTLFVFVGTMSVNGVQGNPVGVALTHGLAITFMVTATGSISGGHLNPAVTLGALLAGATAPLTALLYVISQLLGGILGSALTRGVLTETAFVAIKGGAHALGPQSSVSQGLLCETLITAILVTIVLLTAVDEETKSPLAGLCIGVAVACGVMAGFAISGGSMNPARSFGPAMSTYNDDMVFSLVLVITGASIHTTLPRGSLVPLPFANCRPRNLIHHITRHLPISSLP